MKKIYFLLTMILASMGVWAQLFQQNFSSSTVVADYVNAAPSNGQFNAIGSSGAGTILSINTTGSNKLRFARTGNAGSYSRTTDFSPTPTSLMYRFDLTVSGNSVAQTTAAVWQVGSGFGTANSGEANANVHSRIGLNWTNTAGQFSIRNLGTSVNSANYSGTQTITWVINNSGATLIYKAPDGTYETVGDDVADLWVGTTKEFDEIAATTSTQSLTDLKFVFTAGTGTVDIDNILIDQIPAIPTSGAALPIGSTSFTANWTAVTGVTGYRIDVATDAAFTSLVTGYDNLYVSGQATNSLNVNTNINPSTQYYYRVRSASQYTVGEFASGNSATQTLTTTSGVAPAITLTPTSLSGFTYVAGAGPSGVQSFSVSGINLTGAPGNITVTAPTNYEINDGNGWVSSFDIPYATATLGSTNVDVRLKAGLAVGTYNGEIITVAGGGDSKNETLSGSVTLGTPVANAPTIFTATSFTADWAPGVAGATAGYFLDASASSTFSTVGTLVSDGFENSLSLFTETSGTGTYYTGNSDAVNDRPISSPFASAGTYAYGKLNGTLTITSSPINTSASSNTQLSFKLASFSIGSTSNGADAGDIVTVEISPDGGTNFYSTVRVLGNGNAYWEYAATGVASTAYDGNSSPVDFQPVAGGNRTTDGYSTVIVTGLPSVSNLIVRITLLNNASSELWLIDNLSVTGTIGSFLTGYNNLAVAGTSQAVTVPGPGTYYYRVRATTGSVTSANSNVVSVIMNNQNTAAFRSTGTGDYSDNGSWEFNVSPPSYFAGATQVPTINNDVTIQNGHTITLTGAAAANSLSLGATGNIILGTNNLVVNNTTGGSTTGYIRTNGTGTLTVNNITTGKTLPVGNSTYNPLLIENGSGLNWSARVIDGLTADPGYNTDRAVLRQWDITPSVNPPAAGADITFQFDQSNEVGPLFNTATSVQAWRNPLDAGWVTAGSPTAATVVNPTTTTVKVTGLTGFSKYALSNIDGPLPVTLLSFSGYKDGSRNQLSWTTGTEINNRGFDVQRSTDGVNYTSIGFVNSLAFGGNSNDRLSYRFTDNTVSGVKQYYRLRQENLDGRSKLSNIVLINGAKPSVIALRGIFPNPAQAAASIIIDAPTASKLTLLLTDMAGRNVTQQIVTVSEGSNTVAVNIASLQSGTYLVRVINELGEVVTGKLVKE